MKLIDSHVHLEVLENIDFALENAKEAEVGTIITIGTSIESSKKAIEIAKKYSAPRSCHPHRSEDLIENGFPIRSGMTGKNNLKIYASVGIHPQDGKDEVEKLGLQNCMAELKMILKQVQNDKVVVAIGECGLDYYLDNEKRISTVDKDKEFQRKLFLAQVELSQELNLPLIIHCRNAWEDLFRLLSIDDRRSTPKGVFHSFTGDWQSAKQALDLGFYISFSGIVTFKNAKDIQEAAKEVPPNRILVETDSPFLAPEPVRGSKNEPKNVKLIAEFIANLKNISPTDFSFQTYKNSVELFKLG